MTEKPVVQDSASSFKWGLPALVIGVLVMIVGANNRTDVLGLVGIVLVILGIIWTVQGMVRSARNRDAMARAVLEQHEREER